jgi:hypothetical protein
MDEIENRRIVGEISDTVKKLSAEVDFKEPKAEEIQKYMKKAFGEAERIFGNFGLGKHEVFRAFAAGHIFAMQKSVLDMSNNIKKMEIK